MSRVPSNLRRAPFVTLALVVLLSFAGAARSDSHFDIDPAAPIYQRSVFFHGYAHGYELGFHTGDVDLHIGRYSRDPRSVKMFRDAKKYYQPGFGNREMFVNGYENGFRVGYADAFSGRDFRAARELRILAQQLQDTPSAPLPASVKQVSANADLDKGIADGYKQGLSMGLNNARSSGAYRPGGPECPRKDKAGQFCPGHRLGYELGYSDGYNNQRKPEEGIKTARE